MLNSKNVNASTNKANSSYFKTALIQKATLRQAHIKKNPILISEDDDLFEEQKQFINSKARYRIALCSRRAGKTNALARLLRKVAHGGREHNALYIARTTDQCKRIMWHMLLQVLNKYHRPNEYKTNTSEMSVYFKETDSFIWLKGANDSHQIMKLLGVKLKCCVIDEAQSFPAFIETLITTVVSPALTDLQGFLVMAGTPPPLCNGLFVEEYQSGRWENFHWTIFNNKFYLESAMKENPDIKSVDDIIQQECDRRGITIDHPSIQRDYYGKLVKSSELQVYKYTQELQNFLEVPNTKMEVCLGVDLGYDDFDAISVVGFNRGSRICYLLDEYRENRLDITGLAEVLRRFVKKWNPYMCVIDTQGLGKKIAQEITTRFQIPLTAAEKGEKPMWIELLNDELRNGRIKIRATSQTAKEMQTLCWLQDAYDKQKYVEDPSMSNHSCDALLYSWRWIYSYAYKEIIEDTRVQSKIDEEKYAVQLRKHRDISHLRRKSFR